MNMLSNLLLVPTFGALMLSGYALTINELGLLIASLSVMSLGLFIFLTDRHINKKK